MPATFDLLEQRVNRAVVNRLSNAMVTIGVASVPVVFDRLYVDALDGDVAGYLPVITGNDADLAGVVYGTSITVRGDAYTVTALEPDGTGMTRLRLRKA